MRFAAVWLLAILLAACGDSDARTDQEASGHQRFDTPAPPRLAALDWQQLIWPTPVPLALPPAAPAAVFPDALLRPIQPPEPQSEPVMQVQALPPRPAPSAARHGATGVPSLAIIIDDVGHGLTQGRRIIALPASVALAILPHTLHAQRLADEARAAGKTVMLHLPMENQGGLPIGPGGLYAQMSQAEFERVLRENLDSLSGARGVNNHMGSLLTTLRPQMDWLMQELEARGLFFVDSRTSAQTQAADAASARGIAHLSRHVFLDNLRTPEHLALSFDSAIRHARKEGHALLIGHPYPETLAFLERRLPGLEEREGIRVVPVETLLDGQGQND